VILRYNHFLGVALKLGLVVTVAFATVGFMLSLGAGVALGARVALAVGFVVGFADTFTFAGGVVPLADGFILSAAVDITVGTALQKCAIHTTSMRIWKMNILRILDLSFC
jgi:hypothetical protein